MAKKRFELTEAEWTIMKIIWDKEPCTAPVVYEALQPRTDWAYSTARTIMDRMVAKDLLSAQKTSKVTVFKSAITREQAQRGELLYALKNAFSGALRPMVQCLLDTGDLSARELDELEALIRRKKKESKE